MTAKTIKKSAVYYSAFSSICGELIILRSLSANLKDFKSGLIFFSG
ncbi:hypothetical protein SAMN02927903_00016 [Flavobacterium caeni]|uniref:Uncharacterized protein n=1 Tax=Flavobacterium caeni TaxID=490189 RepID=A0A1G5AIZ1_9FLAO|nr:hypothetical protein SAMN02927903_00016 [Flavobacterium caeni]